METVTEKYSQEEVLLEDRVSGDTEMMVEVEVITSVSNIDREEEV